MKLFSLFILLILPISLWAEDNEVFKAKSFKKPIREYSIIATDHGYYPDSVFAYVGEKVKFFVTATSKKSQCFLVKDHNIFLGAEKGKISEGEVVFYSPGRFDFYCPATNFTGHVTVIERAQDRANRVKREVASKKINYWTPRNYD